MGKTTLESKLEALAQGNERSQLGRLRDVLGSVEKALSAGATRAQVLNTLREEGFTFTPRSFDSALYQLRKEKATQRTKMPPGTTSGGSQPPTSLTQTTPRSEPFPTVPLPTSTPEGKPQEIHDPEYEAFLKTIEHLPPREQNKRKGAFWANRPRR